MDTPELGAALLGIDLTSVNRTIAREPAYQSCPQYCLLLVGPEGKTHIWLILDGEKLYVDRNGNGDLTEPGEVFLSPEQAFTVGDITEAASGARHTNFRVGMVPEVKPLKQPGYWSLTLDVEGRYRQYAFVHKPGTSPQDAPVVHFGGPLQMAMAAPEKQTLVRGDKPSELMALVATRYPGVEWAAVDHNRGVPPDVHPLAEITFPGKTPEEGPILVKLPLTQRC